MYNDGYIPDIIATSASPSGSHVLYEVKCYTPFPGTRGAPQHLAQRAEPFRAFLMRLQRHGEELDDVRWGHLLEGSVYRLLEFSAVPWARFGDEDRGRDVEELASLADARRGGGECVVRELAVRERGGQRDVSPGAFNAGNHG